MFELKANMVSDSQLTEAIAVSVALSWCITFSEIGESGSRFEEIRRC